MPAGELLAKADTLVPAPMHWRRLWSVVFHQSTRLAAAVSAESGVPVAAGVLERVKPTAQVGSSLMERAANVEGSLRDRGKQGGG
jgi:predicted amidophosphoribosyltransferase